MLDQMKELAYTRWRPVVFKGSRLYTLSAILYLLFVGDLGMLNNDLVENNRSLTSLPGRGIDIPNAPTVRLQTLDLARHVAINPAGKRYVVATFDDRRINRGFVTAVYPQQDGYLTLVRLVVCELSSQTEEEALRKHMQLVQTIQNGKLNDFVKSLQSE